MYYPKSQIKTDLFTNGGEFYIEGDKNKEPYIGSYYKTSKSEYFIGKKPTLNNRKLLPLTLKTNFPSSVSAITTTLDQSAYDPAPYSSNYNVQEYNKIYGNFTSRAIPDNITPSPTDEDYKRGSYDRYFAKKSNEPVFIETTKDIYLLFKSQDPTVAFDLYEIAFISYQSKGPGNNAISGNNIQIENIEEKYNWKGFSLWCSYMGIGGKNSPPNLPTNPIGGVYSQNKNKIVIDPLSNPQELSTINTLLWDIKPNRPSKNKSRNY